MKNPEIAVRTNPFQESVIREMTRLGDETKAVNLSQGLPDFNPPTEVLEAATSAIKKGENQYTFPFGSFLFREALADKYAQYNHIHADPEKEITITCGVSEAIMDAVMGLTDPGDEVIIFEPWYENYVPDCFMAGVTPRFVEHSEPEYKVDTEKLRAAFNKRTRLILLNTPHNPTGRVYSFEELTAVAELCQEFNVIAVSDETYEHIFYDGYKHTSIGSLEGMHNRTVTISGMSKSYSVTGWRVGWIVAVSPLTSVIRKVHDYFTVCAPAPFQAAGVVALKLGKKYYEEMRRKYSCCRSILTDVLDFVGVDYFKPEGTYYVMLDYKNIKWEQEKYSRNDWTPDRAFAEFMARDIGVAVVPGSSFYTGKDKGIYKVRINFAKKESTLKEAAKRLRKLQRLKK